jgi:hypothetical protein
VRTTTLITVGSRFGSRRHRLPTRGRLIITQTNKYNPRVFDAIGTRSDLASVAADWNGIAMSSIPLLHFNDAYRVQPQKLTSKSPDTIDVTQFSQMVNDIRESWKKSSKEGLVTFSGDLFAPSVESSVTRGTHMVWIYVLFIPLMYRQFPPSLDRSQ